MSGSRKWRKGKMGMVGRMDGEREKKMKKKNRKKGVLLAERGGKQSSQQGRHQRWILRNSDQW